MILHAFRQTLPSINPVVPEELFEILLYVVTGAILNLDECDVNQLILPTIKHV